MVKCLVFHKQAASSYTLPEKVSLRRGFNEKHVDLPPFALPSVANGEFTLRKHILISTEHVSRDFVKLKVTACVCFAPPLQRYCTREWVNNW